MSRRSQSPMSIAYIHDTNRKCEVLHRPLSTSSSLWSMNLPDLRHKGPRCQEALSPKPSSSSTKATEQKAGHAAGVRTISSEYSSGGRTELLRGSSSWKRSHQKASTSRRSFSTHDLCGSMRISVNFSKTFRVGSIVASVQTNSGSGREKLKHPGALSSSNPDGTTSAKYMPPCHRAQRGADPRQ